MWLQKTKPSNASSKWELSGQPLSNVSSSRRTLELCSKRAISLYLQHKFFVSNHHRHHHQTSQKQKDKRNQRLLLYFVSCDFLGLWCPAFSLGGSQSWVCLEAHACRLQSPAWASTSTTLAAAPRARPGLWGSDRHSLAEGEAAGRGCA